MSDWQPIETAPKDGEWVNLYAPNEYGDKLFVGHFKDGAWRPAWLDAHGCGCCGGSWPEPTLWSAVELPHPHPSEAVQQ